MKNQATIIRAAEQSAVWLLRDHVKPMLGGHHTQDQLGVCLTALHPGDGPPPHTHGREDEGFYVLEGEVTFLSGDKLVRATAGTFVWGPRDVVHCFKCTSTTPARMILIVTPTDFMNFAMTLAEPAADFHTPPELTPAKIGQLMSVAPQYGIEMKPDHPMPRTVVTAAQASKRLWVMGEHISFLATSAQTGGRLTVVELRMAPGGGPPPHAHTNEDEIMIVIDGQHEVHLDDRIDMADPGDVVYVPRGTRHRYSNTSSAPGKMLSIHMPGGFEAFFEECGVDAAGHATAPQLPPPPPEAIAELLSRHGMTG